MTSPPSSTASAAPGSRGALRNVLTTVARLKVSSSAHHLVIVSRMSRTVPPRSLTCTTTLPSDGVAGYDVFSNYLSATGGGLRICRDRRRERGRRSADGGHGRSDQARQFRVAEPLRPLAQPGLGQPRVAGDGQPLDEAETGPAHPVVGDRQREVSLPLGGSQRTERGELDDRPAHGRTQFLRIGPDAGLLPQFPGGGLGEALAALDPAADRHPVLIAAAQQLVTEQQQHPPAGVDRQDPGGVPADPHRGYLPRSRGPRTAATAARISRGISGSAGRSVPPSRSAGYSQACLSMVERSSGSWPSKLTSASSTATAK